MKFGTGGDPRAYTGLAPTFLFFARLSDGATLPPPTINEPLTGSGVYHFQYGTTQAIAFLADAATTSPGSAGRYVTGQIDPSDRGDEYGNSLMAYSASLTAVGVTNIAYSSSLTATGVSLTATGVSLMAYGASLTAFGVTSIAYSVSLAASSASLAVSLSGLVSNIGTTGSTFGSNLSDPIDLFGYLKRVQENLEGNNNYIKSSGSFSIYSRGSSALLAAKTISNSVSMVVKS